MTQIRERANGNWQVVVRKAKYSDQRKTFKTKSAAKAWARKVEMIWRLASGVWRLASVVATIRSFGDG